ncbi:MAG TPA: GFA family protein [Steroidobacteraceae bacterium]|nr:GFA family protein [Steroidobacteraceae bacterium]HQR49977.1 GFA family protein [Steroidobacteraceae bacterium]
METPDLAVHRGGCHCGAVAFEVDAPTRVTVHDCNCSMCSMTGYLHLIVPASRFRLVRGAEMLETYTFNTGTAQHLFCRRCGIKSFYVPRSNPDGFSVNLRCVDRSTFERVDVEPFDGRNWEDAGESLAHLSRT